MNKEVCVAKIRKTFAASSLAASALLYAPLASAQAAGGAVTDLKAGWDELWHEMMIDITVIGVVFGAITLYLLLKYRRKSPGSTGKAPRLSSLSAFGWVVIPVCVFMADDIFLAAKNFELWNGYRKVPAGAYVIEVEGSMWNWDFKYPEGIKTTNEMRVPAGRPIHLKMTSLDVVHSFFIPDLRVKWDVVPGKSTYLWFYPKDAGEHVITCTEFCGMLHSAMYGKVISMPEGDFNKWVEQNKTKGAAI